MLDIFTHKAVVLFDGVWRIALGQISSNYNFIFLHNGRIEFAQEGHWYAISYTCSDEIAEQEAIKANVSDIKSKNLK